MIERICARAQETAIERKTTSARVTRVALAPSLCVLRRENIGESSALKHTYANLAAKS